MGRLNFFLLYFIALHFVLNFPHKNAAFESDEVRGSSDHFHIVKVKSLLTASTCSHSARESSEENQLKLVHKYGPCSPKKHEKSNPYYYSHPRKILERDHENDVQIKWDNINTGEYVVNVGLGTPKKELTLVMDTGSSLLWTQCQPCQLGNSSGCYKQLHPIFDPSNSSTYSNITCPSNTCSLATFFLGSTECASSTCVYHTGYVDGTEVSGFLAKESITVGSDTFSDIIFGCNQVGVNDSLPNIDGIIGLGQDFLSFVAQTNETYEKFFSYCLPSKPSEIGFLKFGNKAKQLSNSLKFTKLGYGYAIDLIGIKLGNTTIPITVKKGDASIDSGSVISWLPSRDYANLRDAYRKAMSQYQLTKPVDVLDTCYQIGGFQEVQFPKMSFLFGDGLVLDIPPSGVALPVESNVVCLPFGSIEGVDDMVIFGNTQQKTLEIVYDVAGGQLGFGYSGCN